jgi:alanyl-tRNA synthetase
MESKEIRKKFLEFFTSKGHHIVPSAPIVVKNDPTLMFNNAGMNQFKDFFLGNQESKYLRVANSQKCLRVSGKHNDLEEVGVDTYHHTMFEMLGNWSFGDYFKKDAIEFCWELLTKVYKISPDRLYVTIFEGDQADGLGEDTESYDFWRALVPDEKIIKCDKKDNFWEMGEQGPCGPCSELHVDLRSEEEIAKNPGRALVNKDHPQLVEIWNLVFIQYNRKANGTLEDLPLTHIDTGMGFERLAMALQGKTSNYDTDVFMPMIDYVSKKSGKIYGQDLKTDIAIRVIVDHIRAITFTIADGQLPSNTGAGYVIRRILRRAVRYAYTFLNIEKPFIHELVTLLAEQFTGVFPEVVGQEDYIKRVVEEEEISFLRTLTSGIKRLDSIMASTDKVIDGKIVFELYDTFGFPVDLTGLIARENDLEIDEKGFEVAMKEQKDRSRSATSSTTTDWTELKAVEKVQFVGYYHLRTASNVVKYREVKEKKKTYFQIVLDDTPFYPEGGGQVGDRGYLQFGEEKISVKDTKKENDLIIHFVDKLPSDIAREVIAQVDKTKRKLAESNHSATHLLQSALKEVLGDHIQQKGSLVNEKLLRFDFAHFSKLTEEEILSVEQKVNAKIRENITLTEKRELPIQQAKSMGATALFGEKYGEKVRVIAFDTNYSIELCGGTHVNATGEIGYFKITSEASVASGVRRIEAVTAIEAEKFIGKQDALLQSVNELLKSPKDLTKTIQSLLDDKAKLSKQVETYQQEGAQQVKKDLLGKVQVIDGMNVIIQKVDIDSNDAVKSIAFDLKKQIENLFLVLACNVQNKPLITVMIADELVKSKGLHAGNIIRDLAKEIQGGGGGQPFYASAGGKKIEGLDAVVLKAKELV